jgi:hypothetical protein
MLAPSFLLGCVWMFTLKGGIGNWNLPPSILPFGRPGIRKQNCLRIPLGIRLPCAHLPPIRSLHARYCLAFARVSIPRKAATLSSSWRQPPPSPSPAAASLSLSSGCPPYPSSAAVLHRPSQRQPSSISLPDGSPPSPSRRPFCALESPSRWTRIELLVLPCALYSPAGHSMPRIHRWQRPVRLPLPPPSSGGLLPPSPSRQRAPPLSLPGAPPCLRLPRQRAWWTSAPERSPTTRGSSVRDLCTNIRTRMVVFTGSFDSIRQIHLHPNNDFGIVI